mgnify:FL=1|tara:strand:- start:771 stop:1277 length:507 start_codon:yes stop_codon:yes gene_type:complete
MATRSPVSTFAQSFVTVAAGAAQTFTVPLPSLPYLDEKSRSPGFDLINVMVAAQVGTVVANWAMTVDITFQPIKNGAIGTGRQPGVTTLTFNAQVPATPGSGLTVTCTNNGGAPDTIAISYGGVVAPGLYHPDENEHTHQPPTYGTYMVKQDETRERPLISMSDRANR